MAPNKKAKNAAPQAATGKVPKGPGNKPRAPAKYKCHYKENDITEPELLTKEQTITELQYYEEHIQEPYVRDHSANVLQELLSNPEWVHNETKEIMKNAKAIMPNLKGKHASWGKCQKYWNSCVGFVELREHIYQETNKRFIVCEFNAREYELWQQEHERMKAVRCVRLALEAFTDKCEILGQTDLTGEIVYSGLVASVHILTML